MYAVLRSRPPRHPRPARQMPDDRHATAARVVADDVIVGAELPAAEDVDLAAEQRRLGVVLGFWQRPPPLTRGRSKVAIAAVEVSLASRPPSSAQRVRRARPPRRPGASREGCPLAARASSHARARARRARAGRAGPAREGPPAPARITAATATTSTSSDTARSDALAVAATRRSPERRRAVRPRAPRISPLHTRS